MTRLCVVVVVLLLIGSVVLSGQTRKQIDWKPCSDFMNQFKAQVEKFNAEHKDGFSVMLSCNYSGDPNRKHLPEQKIPLSRSEIKNLHALRKIENAAFAAMEEYKDYLFVAHHIRKPKTSEPCFYFAGIKLDDDWITVDLNSIDPECDEVHP